jgi:hypothetical protein
MKAKYSVAALVMMALLILGTVACNRARSDAQVANDVQGKIAGDKNVPSRQITVQASNGVVTLSGDVGSDAERAAAAGDAAQVEGVKTVVNNLETSAPTVAATQPVQQPAVQEPAQPEPVQKSSAANTSTRERDSARSSRRPSAYHERKYPTDTTTMAAAAPAQTPVVTPAPAAAPAPPPPPPAPVKVTIPDGTTIAIRMIDTVDSETAQPGQVFKASLDSPITIDDNVVVPAHADIEGRVVNVQSAGRVAGKSDLAVELFKLSYNGKTYSIHTNQYSQAGSSRAKTTATRGIGGAALGAIIGGLAGGGKGAAIGATVGGGAGVGSTAIHKGQQIKLTSEQVLTFTLQSPLTVTPASNMNREPNRRRLED